MDGAISLENAAFRAFHCPHRFSVFAGGAPLRDLVILSEAKDLAEPPSLLPA